MSSPDLPKTTDKKTDSPHETPHAIINESAKHLSSPPKKQWSAMTLENGFYTVNNTSSDNFMFSIACRSLIAQQKLGKDADPIHNADQRKLVEAEMDRIIEVNKEIDPRKFKTLSRTHVVVGWKLQLVDRVAQGENACAATPPEERPVVEKGQTVVVHAGQCYEAKPGSWTVLEPGAGVHAQRDARVSLAPGSFVEAEPTAFINIVGNGKIVRHGDIRTYTASVKANPKVVDAPVVTAQTKVVPADAVVKLDNAPPLPTQRGTEVLVTSLQTDKLPGGRNFSLEGLPSLTLSE